MNRSCSLYENVSMLDDREIPVEEREALDRHLAACFHCRGRFERLQAVRRGLAPAADETDLPEGAWEQVLSVTEEELERDSGFAQRVLERRKKAARGKDLQFGRSVRRIAAAVLLAVGIGAAAWGMATRRFPSGDPTEGGTDPAGRFFGSMEVSEPWSGIRIGTGPDSRYRVSDRNGQPAVFLQEGTLAVETAPGRTGFRVETAMGEVEVIGTRFRVQIERMVGKPFAVSVRVTDGRVRLKGTHGTIGVDGGFDGFLFTARPPQVQQRLPLSPAVLRDRLQAVRTLLQNGDVAEARVRWILLSDRADPKSEEIRRFREDPKNRLLFENGRDQ